MNKTEIVESVIMPVDIQKAGGKFSVVCVRFPRQYFTTPFFVESLFNAGILDQGQKSPKEDIALARPLHFKRDDERIVYIPAEEFLCQHADIESSKKAGFIFHMSRCGSTLATQMLATSQRCFVLSEPTVLNAIFNPALKLSIVQRKELFNAAVRSLAKCSPKGADFLFIKFRSWNTFFLQEIMEKFPQVSWIFMHRK
jgi:hypothetical protein